MPIDPVYLCKDCKFSRLGALFTIVTLGGHVGASSFMYTCSKAIKPEHEVIDAVTGPKKIKVEVPYCAVERGHGDCGPTAKHWVPKRKKDLFKMLTKDYND